MGAEVSRAGEADRERYDAHLDELWVHGFVTKETELDSLRDRIMRSSTLLELDRVLDGFPKPEPLPHAKRARDWGVPRNYLPPTIVAATFGLLLAVMPSATFAAGHGEVWNFATALTLVVGLIITAVSLGVMVTMTVKWEDEDDKKGRLFLDENR